MTAAVTLCAVIVTAMLVQQRYFGEKAEDEQGIRRIDNWESLAEPGHYLGPRNAPLKIVVFADFECPFCREATETLSSIRRQYPDSVAVVYRHFPLGSEYGSAFEAALAAECAAEEDRFWDYHDLLYRWQDSLRDWDWETFADLAGVRDLESFSECVSQRRYLSLVERDVDAGEAIRLQGTPTLIINGSVYPGAPSEARLDSLIGEIITH